MHQAGKTRTFCREGNDNVTDLYGVMCGNRLIFDPRRRSDYFGCLSLSDLISDLHLTTTLDDSWYCMAQLGFIVITVGHRGDTPDAR